MGGGLIVLATTQNFTKKIVISFFGDKTQNWLLELVFQTTSANPPLHLTGLRELELKMTSLTIRIRGVGGRFLFNIEF